MAPVKLKVHGVATTWQHQTGSHDDTGAVFILGARPREGKGQAQHPPRGPPQPVPASSPRPRPSVAFFLLRPGGTGEGRAARGRGRSWALAGSR